MELYIPYYCYILQLLLEWIMISEADISFTTLEVVEIRTTIWCTQIRVWCRVLVMICRSLCVKNLQLVTMSVLHLIYNSDVSRINLRSISSYCDFCNCVLYIVAAEVQVLVMYHISHMIQGCNHNFPNNRWLHWDLPVLMMNFLNQLYPFLK